VYGARRTGCRFLCWSAFPGFTSLPDISSGACSVILTELSSVGITVGAHAG
jgi:hypothetical protein